VPRPPSTVLATFTAHGSSKPVRVGRFVVIRPVSRRPSVRSPPKRRPTCPRVLTLHQPRQLAHLTLSAPFRVEHQPYPASSPRPRRWRPTPACSTGSCRLFDAPAFTSGSSSPAEELASPYGRLTGHTEVWPDLNGVSTFRTSETRPGWVPSLPRGPRCSPDRSAVLQPACAASRRPVPGPRCSVPSAGLHVTRHHRGFHLCSPVRSSPSPVAAGWNSDPWA
jgi:hypothetical protein